MQLTQEKIEEFYRTVGEFYAAEGRHNLPWRLRGKNGAYDPYAIFVSELMLQQTQVARVIPKFNEFLKQFPSLPSLAQAELADVIRYWQGLGYNRRAKYLWLAAQQIQTEDAFPTKLEELVKLPGVGVNTAGAIAAYAFNQPVVFIETNIRTVYIHHFTPNETDIHDDFIRDLVAQTLPRTGDAERPIDVAEEMGIVAPREFYWALMDYGAKLKQHIRINTLSRHYKRQSAFQGSRRQIRGAVIRELGTADLTVGELAVRIPDERLPSVLKELVDEGMIRRNLEGTTYGL